MANYWQMKVLPDRVMSVPRTMLFAILLMAQAMVGLACF